MRRKHITPDVTYACYKLWTNVAGVRPPASAGKRAREEEASAPARAAPVFGGASVPYTPLGPETLAAAAAGGGRNGGGAAAANGRPGTTAIGVPPPLPHFKRPRMRGAAVGVAPAREGPPNAGGPSSSGAPAGDSLGGAARSGDISVGALAPEAGGPPMSGEPACMDARREASAADSSEQQPDSSAPGMHNKGIGLGVGLGMRAGSERAELRAGVLDEQEGPRDGPDDAGLVDEGRAGWHATDQTGNLADGVGTVRTEAGSELDGSAAHADAPTGRAQESREAFNA